MPMPWTTPLLSSSRCLFAVILHLSLLSLPISAQETSPTNNDTVVAPDLFCYGYIINKTATELFTAPAAIPCSSSANNSFGVRWGPPEHQSLACCTGNGRFYVQTSQIGGFDSTFAVRTIDPTCQAYSAALQAVLCDPRQGNYIKPPPKFPQPIPEPEDEEEGEDDVEEDEENNNNTTTLNNTTNSTSQAPSTAPSLSTSPSTAPSFSTSPSMAPTEVPDPVLTVCQSSCDAVFDACGLPGVNFAEYANYNDGTSLCLDSWGGFGQSSPCNIHPDGFPCMVNLQLNVSSKDCLELVVPNNEVIESYARDRAPPVPEQCDTGDSVTVVEAVTVVAIIIAGVCTLLCIMVVGWIYCRRRQMDLVDAGEW